ncbi:MAG: biotin transporter BioY [Bacteroidota bacterium]
MNQTSIEQPAEEQYHYRKKWSGILVGILLICLCAQITINVGDIPITGQTLAVLAVALIFQPIDTIIIVSSYLLVGAIGLPVFADGSAGWEKLTGGSGGFLIGFLVASVVVSYLFHQKGGKEIISIIGFTALGTIIILIFGISKLAYSFGLDKALEYGFYPFWKGAIIKVLLGSFLVRGFYNIKAN